MEEKKKGPLFDLLYDATEAVKKGLKKPLVRNQLKRKLKAAYDDAELFCALFHCLLKLVCFKKRIADFAEAQKVNKYLPPTSAETSSEFKRNVLGSFANTLHKSFLPRRVSPLNTSESPSFPITLT